MQRPNFFNRLLNFLPGMGSDDKREHAWKEYGWKEELCFQDFYKLYERQGVAQGVVNLLNNKCFETNPWVIEGDEFDEKRKETPWEKQFRLFAKKSKLWKAFKTADRYRLVGKYAAIIIQLQDGLGWDQPAGTRPVVKRFIPAWEGQLTPTDIVQDETSDLYGEPGFWQYKESAVQPNMASGETAILMRDVKIHPDRIIILGDWRAGSSFLKPGYNAFVNLEKIEGGSGESYLKNAARQISINFDKETKVEDLVRANGLKNAEELQGLIDDQTRDLNTGIDASMVTWGGTVTPLVAVVPDPTPHYSINIQTIAASVEMPAKVISGMQTGERASVEDLKQFNKRGQGRRISELTDEGEQIVGHLFRIAVMPAPDGETTFMWDDLTEASFAEKLANAKTMGEVNSSNAGNGDMPVFASAEIREAAGYDNDPETDRLREDDMPDVEPEPIVPDTAAPAVPVQVAV